MAAATTRLTRRLLTELRAGLGRAQEANAAYAGEALDRRRVAALGVAYVRSESVDGLGASDGVNPRTRDRLLRAGVLRVGDAVDRDLLHVPGIDWKQVEALERYIRRQLADAEGRAETWFPGMACPFPEHPEVVAEHARHAHALARRQHLLKRDLVELAEVEQEVGGGASGRGVWVGRPPDPTRFGEQRVQLVTLQMARAAGLPPPEVRFEESLEPGVTRRGRALVLHPAVVDALDEPQLYALVAHALCRRGGAVRWAGPVRGLTALALALLGAASVRIARRVVTLDDRVYRVPRVGLRSVLFLLLSPPLAVVALPLLVVDVGVRALGAPGRWLATLRADREAVALVRSATHLAVGLRALDRLRVPDEVGRLHALVDRPGARRRWALATPSRTLRLRWGRLLARLGLGAPSTESRIRAVTTEGSPLEARVWSGAWSCGQAVVAAVALGLCLSVGRWGPLEHLQGPSSWAALRPALDWVEGISGEGAAEGSSRTWKLVPARGCHLRARPRLGARSLGVMPRGTTCSEAGPEQGRWLNLRCGAREGYVHRGCLSE